MVGRVGSGMCDWGWEDSCWETGYRCLSALLGWGMKKCQGGRMHCTAIGSAGEQGRETPHPQPSASLHQVQSVLPKSQCWVLPLINNGINYSMLHSWGSGVQFLPTLFKRFRSPLHLYITHIFFICSVQWYKLGGICLSLPASLPTGEDISSLISCQLWLFYFFIFSCCPIASRNTFQFVLHQSEIRSHPTAILLWFGGAQKRLAPGYWAESSSFSSNWKLCLLTG